ncbi:TonB-dependent receptor [Lysobacter koreensis]|uniref:TonB-dependent receptor n=1 Tax=Lysobacter koreensis TaxID=266122 RepID=A0ABW2YSC4_9GAMM
MSHQSPPHPRHAISPLAGALAFALSLHAAAAPAPEPAAAATDLARVDVTGQRVLKASSPKYTGPLLDTPQTINVIDRETIEDQNLLSLRDILATLPGITFGAGEGGGGFGDKINLRGFSGDSDITVDGVRDSGLYSRTDPFNLESVEVTNGANSAYTGAGSVGGSVNLVSKAARADEFNHASIAAGTDSYARVTADSNLLIGEGAALRLNVMAHQNDIPGRDVEQMQRWGFAPSIAFGLGSDTAWTLSYLHQEDENTPQYGVAFVNGAPVPGVDPWAYYGYRNVDRQDTEVDVFTSEIKHAFSDNFSLRNLTRRADVGSLTVVDAPSGNYCLANGTDAATGGACINGTAPGTYRPSGNRGTTRDTRNTVLHSQFDALVGFRTAAIEHDLVAGFSTTQENFDLVSGSSLRDDNYLLPTLPLTSIANPDSFYTGRIKFIANSRQQGSLDNRALYVFDTLKFNEQWQFNAGVRYERNEGSHRTDAVATPNAGGAVTPGPTLINDEDLFSYRAGLVFKPVENGSIYLAYGNAKTPSKASVNGACTAATCAVDPETAQNIELGTKWDVLGERLSLTASVFRNERSNYKVADPNNPDNPSGFQQLDGRARVDGLLLGVSGLIADHWSIFANYAYLDSEVLQGASDFVAGQGQDYTRGDRLLNVPENSFSLWTTYDLSPKWQVGYGASYQGELTLTQHSATNVAGSLLTAPSYWVHRAMAAYKLNRHASLQLNVNNLFDEQYYTRIRNNANGWATPGEGRSVVLSANFSF